MFQDYYGIFAKRRHKKTFLMSALMLADVTINVDYVIVLMVAQLLITSDPEAVSTHPPLAKSTTTHSWGSAEDDQRWFNGIISCLTSTVNRFKQISIRRRQKTA